MRTDTLAQQRNLHALCQEVVLRHYRKPLTITAVARVLSVSPRQLQRAYARFGEGTFREDLIAARMRNAARVLAEYPAIPISDVGRLVGYSQGPHFSRAFRRRYGLTPARFRQEAVRGRAQGRVMLKER